MSLQFDLESHNALQIARLHESKLGESSDLNHFSKRVLESIPQNKPKAVLIDFSCVTFVNSSNLGILISLENQLAALGVKLALFNLQPAITDLFRMTYTDRIIPCHPDQATAEAAFAEAS